MSATDMQTAEYSPDQRKRLDAWASLISVTTPFTETDVRDTADTLAEWGLSPEDILTVIGPLAAYADAWGDPLPEATDMVGEIMSLTSLGAMDAAEILSSVGEVR